MRSGDDFDFTSQDSEERNKAFYGDDYTILSNPTNQDQMSMTMQQRQMQENLNKIALLKRDIDQIKYKVQRSITEGEHLSGTKFDFAALIKRYEVLADKSDENPQYEQEWLEDEFLEQIQSDPSQAELMVLCQRLNLLMITLRYKKDELKACEGDQLKLEQGIPIPIK